MKEGESQVLSAVPDGLQGVGEEVKVQPKKSQIQKELRRKARGTKREGKQTNLETKDGVMKTKGNDQTAQNSAKLAPSPYSFPQFAQFRHCRSLENHVEKSTAFEHKL